MLCDKRSLKYFMVIVLCTVLVVCPVCVQAGGLLTKGVESTEVYMLQKHLAELDFFNVEPTGYYGEITEYAVMNFQRTYGLYPDGIAGSDTLGLIDEILFDRVLKEGMSGEEVMGLQENLVDLGFLHVEATGYFGELTHRAVIDFQKANGLSMDGIAGKETLAAIHNLMDGKQNTTSGSRDADRNMNYMSHWSVVSGILKVGTTAVVYDIKTGLSFNVKRTYGVNHSDTETLTKQDTEIMKKICGRWSWSRRAIIVKVNGMEFAASMNSMPHAGLDRYAANAYLNSRSGGYGKGYNLDAVKNNDMDGHFCIHFYGSRLHSNNQVDWSHQEKVKEANEWAKRNYTD